MRRPLEKSFSKKSCEMQKDYIKMNFEHEQNKEKMLKLVEEKRKQALRRAEIAAREKKESELNLTAKRLEPDGKYFDGFSVSELWI